MVKPPPLWKRSPAEKFAAYQRRKAARDAAKAATTTTTTETTTMAKRAIDLGKLPEILKDNFPKLLQLDREIEAAKNAHVKPIADERTEVWRKIKADTNIARKDVELNYKLWKRNQDAADMDDGEAGEKIKMDLARIQAALIAGELTLSEALDAVEEIGDDEPERRNSDDDFPLDDDEPESEGSEHHTAAGGEQDDEAGGPDNDWGPDQQQDQDEADSFNADSVGIFNAGKEAGFQGKSKDDNPHPKRSTEGKLWEKGRQAGAQRSETEVDAYNEGWAAHKADQPRENNPYPEGTDNAVRWSTGWYERAKKMARDAGSPAGADAVLH